MFLIESDDDVAVNDLTGVEARTNLLRGAVVANDLIDERWRVDHAVLILDAAVVVNALIDDDPVNAFFLVTGIGLMDVIV